jgi:hypothetical protein
MATNPTNSTTVSILNLPQAQLATATDNLVLQTTNGTQIISFQNFNVVKTDINGNATVVGNLSGNNATFIGGINTVTLTASQYYTTGGQQGYTPPLPSINYYDSFTIANGLIVSAIPTSVDYINNPIYTTLHTQITGLSSTFNSQLTSISATLNTQLTAMSSYVTTQLQAATASYGTQLNTLTSYSTGIYDATVNASIQPAANGSLSGVIIPFTNFFNGLPLGINQIIPSNFIISPAATTFAQATAYYAAAPFIVQSSISSINGGTGLQVTVSAANIVSAQLPINVRLLVTYNAVPH